MLDVIGIGDLHFDGPLAKHLSTMTLHDMIVAEVQVAIKYARENGIRDTIFYGDIGHKPLLSVESTLAFAHLLQAYPKQRFWIITGNHDLEQKGVHSLRLLKFMCQWMPNVKVLDKPTTCTIGGEQVRFLPWPHSETEEGALNVLHIEVSGSKWDTGRAAKTELRIPKRHFCVAGHLHTAQVVKNVHYSGTLYQTNFGESLPKYFHHIRYEGGEGEAKLVRHHPTVTLHNIVIRSKKDFKAIPEDPNSLCKVFVHQGVEIDPDAFDKLPNVVKTNSFKTKEELTVLLTEDFVLDDDSGSVQIDYDDVLEEWLNTNQVPSSLRKKVLKAHGRLMEAK